jgi:hypothetical protein
MIRLTFSFLLLLHGLLHLLGFGQAHRLLAISQLSGRTLISFSPASARVLGWGWLLACCLFVTAFLFFIQKKDWWWAAGLAAVFLSQVLIILNWPEAKYGTLPNVIVLAGLMLAIGAWSFQGMVRQERQLLLDQPLPEKNIITRDMIRGLPAVVQKWLIRSHVPGKQAIGTVRLKQKGQMRTSPAGQWWPMAADQHFSVEKPGFIWVADVKAAPFIHLTGRDKYQDGKGHMLIKLLGLLPVVNSRGKEIDQGTLLRYLAEIVWFPSAALQDYITWEQVGSDAARATMSYGGVTASGLFRFSPEGDFLSFEARRYYDRKEGATLETWLVAVAENGYREFAGIRVPAKTSVTWKLDTGDFTWCKLEVTDITYNSR